MSLENPFQDTKEEVGLSDFQMKDFYERLGISKTATEEEIKKAYRTLVQKYHPDKNPDNKESEEFFKLIAEAYETLTDDDKKIKYDSSLLPQKNVTGSNLDAWKESMRGYDPKSQLEVQSALTKLIKRADYMKRQYSRSDDSEIISFLEEGKAGKFGDFDVIVNAPEVQKVIIQYASEHLESPEIYTKYINLWTSHGNFDRSVVDTNEWIIGKLKNKLKYDIKAGYKEEYVEKWKAVGINIE